VGLDLYNLPAADFAVEAMLVLACCALYTRTFAHSAGQRRWVAVMTAALLGLQAMLDYGVSRENPVWEPSLSQRQWRTQLTFVLAEGAAPLRMPFALSQGTLSASAQWRSMECEA
jgi:hypothetical protein